MDNYSAKNKKFLRQNNHLTQQELRNKLGKDYSTIGKWENGSRAPIMNDLFDVANYFNVSLDDLTSKNLALLEEKGERKSNNIEYLLSKCKGILTKDDEDMIKFIIEKRRREVDSQEEV
jgi:transcriptional regulator with XRE-family HTH domain